MTRSSSAHIDASDTSRAFGGGTGVAPVGKYRVLTELGRGGMANVYLAVAQGAAAVNKLVVLKALLPDMAAEPESLAMFLDEARLAVRLNHDNVVQTFEVGIEGNRHVIVMEYLEGQSLAAVLRRSQREGRPLPLNLHLRVMICLLEGLHYTHELQGFDGQPLHLVHRDVSPQNLLITYDGRAKILDFGIAKATTSTTHTDTGVLKGKIAYMCPEQLAGEPVDRRADVYSVGCMLWAAATGQRLWKDISDAQILRRSLDGLTPRPSSVTPLCDPELERIVMRALAHRPAERYQTALELQEDLEAFCARIGAHDRPRELASFVSNLFADTRASMKACIERGLTERRRAPESAADSTHSDVLNVADIGQGTSRTQTATVSAATVPAVERKLGGRKPAFLLIGAGLFAVASIAFALSRRATPDDVAIAPSAAPRAASVTSEAPQPRMKIELRATPGEARLYLDGELVQGNPAIRVLPADGRIHQLRGELDGYQTASAEFSVTREDAVALKLEPLSKTPSKTTGKKGEVTSKPTKKTPAKAPAAAPNCAQPFFVDSDGIKKVKPGCL